MASSDHKKVRRVAKYGAEHVAEAFGAATGSIVGILVGGHGAPLLAGAASAVLSHTFGDVAKRFLSTNEEIRIGSAAYIAAGRIQQYLVEGRPLRQDGFFCKQAGQRSDGEEILEGVLLSCRDLFEEKKLSYVANIFVNAAFLDVDAEIVHYVLKVSDRLTYRDLCMAAIVGRKSELGFNTDLLQHTTHMSGDQTIESTVRTELQQQKASIIRSIAVFGNDYPGMIAGHDDEYGKYKLTTFGRTVFSLMGLENLPVEDITPLIDVLQTCEPTEA